MARRQQHLPGIEPGTDFDIEIGGSRDQRGATPSGAREKEIVMRRQPMVHARKNRPARKQGSSQRAITEEQHDDAMRVLRAEYYQGVRGISQELADRVASGEITERDGLEQALSESIDSSYWVIYTHANFQVLLCTDHHDEYSEQYGEAPLTNGKDINWAALAYAAIDRDVRDQMDAEGVGADLEESRHTRRR